MKSIKLKNEGSLLLAKNEVRADIFSGSLAVFQLAEGVGFEPTKDRQVLNGFQDHPDQPLSHPSRKYTIV